MNIATVSLIIIGASGALLGGMAALIKAMVLSRLDHLQETLSGLHRDLHRVDVRLAKLEAEHNMRMEAAACHNHNPIYGV